MSPPARENRSSIRSAYFNPLAKQIIPYENLTEQTTLGEGEFGIVQKGIWTTDKGDTVQVAIKCLSKEKLQSATTEFLKEAGLMQSIDHDHIVRMFGVVLDKENTLMLVTELAPYRSLLECLRDPSLRHDFPLTQLCDFAQQICDGMAYLENKRLIHRDLAARNVLVFTKSQVKISDFGLSRALGVGNDYYQTRFTSNLKLPIAWCAPEAISYLKFTSASDAWSYGVTLWEIFTYGQQPWTGLSGQQILETIDIPKCGRLEQPELASKGHYELMLSCWEHEPSNRPSFSKIHSKLPQLRPVFVKATRDYPEPVVQKDFLFYKAYDAIIVLDKSPTASPQYGLWRGMLNTGKSGFFDPSNTAPFVEVKSSPVDLKTTHVVRRTSSERKPPNSRKLRLDMISRPMDDLRHTGHIGYDGAVFGDVAFMGDNVNKIPVKSISPGYECETLPPYSRDTTIHPSQSDLSLSLPTTNGIGGHTWMSEMSLASGITDDDDSSGEKTPCVEDMGSFDDDMESFKLPDLSMCLDFGPSFMDEVFKALEDKHEKAAAEVPQKSKSPSPTRRIVKEPSPPIVASPRKSSSRETSSERETSPFHIDQSRKASSSLDQSMKSSSPQSNSPVPVKRVYRKDDGGQSVRTDPPPVPSNLPRVESTKRETKPEPKRQAKVKPMSTSSLKMLEEAMAADRSGDTLEEREPVTPPISAEVKGSESPTLVSRLKNSFKKSSPKEDRKRTFSEEITNKASIDNDLHPDEQQAYDLLVGNAASTTKPTLTRVPSDRPVTAPKPSPKPRIELLRSTSRTRPEIHIQRVEPTPRQTVEPLVRSSIPRDDDETTDGYLDDKALNMPPTAKEEDSDLGDSDEDLKADVIKPANQTDDFKTDIAKTDTKINEYKNDEIDGKTDSNINDDDTNERTFLNSDKIITNDDAVFIKPSNIEQKMTGAVPTYRSASRRESAPAVSKSRFADFKNGSAKINFDQEFDEPSPREIMSRLARESRLRRGSDISDSSEASLNRNLREPQGIPGKTASVNGDDDEEVDTNPLRMLRGGALPIRGSRPSVDGALPSRTSLTTSPPPRPPRRQSSDDNTQKRISRSNGAQKSTTPSDSRSSTSSIGNRPKSSVNNERQKSTDSDARKVSLSRETSPKQATTPTDRTQKSKSRETSPKQGTTPTSPKHSSAYIPIDHGHNTRKSSIPKSTSRLKTVAERTSSDVPKTGKTPSDKSRDRYQRNSSDRGTREAVKIPTKTTTKSSSSMKNSTVKSIPSSQKHSRTKPDRNYATILHSDTTTNDDVTKTNTTKNNPTTLTDSQEITTITPTNTQTENPASIDDDVFLNYSEIPNTRSPSIKDSMDVSRVSCDLVDIGYYDVNDLFWSPDGPPDPALPTSYKRSDSVSYEDLLVFDLKNRTAHTQEVESVHNVFRDDVCARDCELALHETNGDIAAAVKLIKLKLILSLGIAEAEQCKQALIACRWDVEPAANYLLNHARASPETVAV